MNSYIQQFASTVVERFIIQTECSAEGMTVLCTDLAGNLVTSRRFSAKQLKNAPLVSLVLSDLRNTLYKPSEALSVTPLPPSHHSSAT